MRDAQKADRFTEQPFLLLVISIVFCTVTTESQLQDQAGGVTRQAVERGITLPQKLLAA